jgi:hypothetical protein
MPADVAGQGPPRGLPWTLPGVGEFTALAAAAQAGDITRSGSPASSPPRPYAARSPAPDPARIPARLSPRICDGERQMPACGRLASLESPILREPGGTCDDVCEKHRFSAGRTEQAAAVNKLR